MPIGAGAGAAPAGASSGASAGCSTPSGWASSPGSYISRVMSEPPISSPLTNNCGVVRQSDSALSSWRMRGSGSTSTAAKPTLSACRAAVARAEKPQAGASGTPFMKRITSLSRIASAIASRRGLVSSLMSLGLRRQGQGVDGAADLVAEHRVDHPVLLDARLADEGGGDDGGPEVVAAAGPILHAGARVGDGGFDPVLDVLGSGHRVSRQGTWRSLHLMKHDHDH